LVKSASRKVKGSDGLYTYYYRENLNMLHYSKESISPEAMAFGYLSDFSTWNITGQENIAGRDCYVIEGTLSGDYSKKLNAASFKLWVDSEIGILLKYENYDSAGVITDKLNTNHITVNQEISDQQFEEFGAKYFKS
jgi:outer membrane lipoprotein-sorting protein